MRSRSSRKTRSKPSPTIDPTAILKHDAVRPALPSVLLALEHADSDDYFQQLLSIDSTLQALDVPKNTMILKLQAVFDRVGRFADEYAAAERPLVELNRLIEILQELQTAARKGFNSRARSLRKVRVGIMDLPNDLLSMIFDHLKRRLDDPNFAFDLLPVDSGADAMAIQNVRLTCRRFHGLSSHLLVRQLDISPTVSSLEHLLEVTSHPGIWRGERVLKIDLRYYSAAMAGDLQAFSAMCYDKLLTKIDSHEGRVEYPESGSRDGYASPDDEAEDVFAQLRRILVSWEPFREGRPIEKEKKAARLSAAARALRRGHERYRELFQQQQEILRGGRFARIVAEVAARSQSRVWLSMSDNGRHPGDEGPDLPEEEEVQYSDLEEFAADPDFLVQSDLTRPHAWWHAKGAEAGEIPQSLLYELPLAMRASKTRLAGVAVSISQPCKLGLNFSQHQLSGLSKVAEGLEAFTFRMEEATAQEAQLSVEEMNSLYAYLRAAMGPQSVPSLWLELPATDYFDGELDYEPSGQFSIEPLLCSPGWHRLKFARLNHFKMDLQDLRTLMGMLESKVRFSFGGIYLSSGTWAAALDCLRSKAAWGSELRGPEGPECGLMTASEYCDSFVDDERENAVSKATQYITSVEGVENPCRRRDEANGANPEH